jgi:hypothetical protein
MSVPTLNAKTLRAVRWLQIAGLLLSTADLVRDLLRGYQGDAIFAAVLIAFWSLMLCAQTKLIRRREELERPRPDYSAIAAMEREVYGEAIEHEGAPAAFVPPPPVPFMGTLSHGVSMAEFGRGMKHLTAALDSRKTLCERGHGDQLWVQGRGQMCPQCERQRDDYEHRSNLRWERPS